MAIPAGYGLFGVCVIFVCRNGKLYGLGGRS